MDPKEARDGWRTFDQCSISANATAVEVFRTTSEKRRVASGLQAIHRNGAVMRSGEYRLSETASGPPAAGFGAQPTPHNPRKQRENPAAAGCGERFRGAAWRRGRGRDRTFSKNLIITMIFWHHGVRSAAPTWRLSKVCFAASPVPSGRVRRRCPTSARRHLSRHWSKQHTSSIFIVNGLGRSEPRKSKRPDGADRPETHGVGRRP